MSSFWESVYDDDPRISRLQRLEPGAVFDWLNAHLPSMGTAVDWARVEGEHTHWLSESEGFADVLSEFLAAIPKGSGAVSHEGDSLSPFPVRIKSNELRSAAEALLEIPEHHYFVDEQHRWVGVFRTEGDIDLVVLGSGGERTFAEDE